MRILCTLLVLTISTSTVYSVDIDQSEAPVSLTANSTMEWGYNFDTGAHGFLNTANMNISMSFIGKDTYIKQTPGLTGYIELRDVEWTASQSPGGVFSPSLTGTITAKVSNGPVYLSVFGAPSFLIDMNRAVAKDDTGNISFSGFQGYQHGSTIGYASDEALYEWAFKVLSDGQNWRTNTSGDYAFGLDVKGYPIPGVVEFSTSLAGKVTESPIMYGGIQIPVYIELFEGFIITPAADFRFANEIFDFDLGISSRIDLSYMNEDKVMASFDFKVFLGSDGLVSLETSFIEPALGGIIDGPGVNISYSRININGNEEIPWYLETGGSYRLALGRVGILEPVLGYRTDHKQRQNLYTIIGYRYTQVPNTTMSIAYTSGNLLGTSMIVGEITAKISVNF